jgi:hypothetical protein
MSDEQLTPHFTLAELIVTDTGLDNTPPPDVIPVLQHLAEFLERVRDEALGGEPVTVDSAYRSPAVNAAVGGVPNSAHQQGHAADIICPAFGPSYEVAIAVQGWVEKNNIAFDQIIHERGVWVHISPQNSEFGQRGQFLTLTDDGDYIDGIQPA